MHNIIANLYSRCKAGFYFAVFTVITPEVPTRTRAPLCKQQCKHRQEGNNLTDKILKKIGI